MNFWSPLLNGLKVLFGPDDTDSTEGRYRWIMKNPHDKGLDVVKPKFNVKVSRETVTPDYNAYLEQAYTKHQKLAQILADR